MNLYKNRPLGRELYYLFDLTIYFNHLFNTSVKIKPLRVVFGLFSDCQVLRTLTTEKIVILKSKIVNLVISGRQGLFRELAFSFLVPSVAKFLLS